MEWLLSRAAVIFLALLASVSVCAGTALKIKRRNRRTASLLNLTGYALLGLSILIFIVLGFKP